MQCFVGTQKNRLNETLVFVYSNAFFCKTRVECKVFDAILFATTRAECKVFDSILFAAKLLLAQTTECSL